MLLGRTPIFWLVDPWLTVAAFVPALTSYYGVRRVSDRLPSRTVYGSTCMPSPTTRSGGMPKMAVAGLA